MTRVPLANLHALRADWAVLDAHGWPKPRTVPVLDVYGRTVQLSRPGAGGKDLIL
jgi:hypothetical protein